MKTKAIFITMMTLVLISVSSMASTSSIITNTPDGIRSEIIKKLSNTKASLDILNQAELRICFTINSEGKMEIEKIQSNTPELEDYFQNKLNGTKVTEKKVDPKQYYWITLKYRMV